MEQYADYREELFLDLGYANNRYERGKRDASVKSQYEMDVRRMEAEVAEIKATSDHMRDIYSNIKSYAVKHRERSRNILDLAIQEAGELVPDANTTGIHLNDSQNGMVTIVNDRGQNINVREGCGYRAILGALLRYACIKAQPNAFPLLIFDEYFFTLSDITTAVMRDVFLALKKDMSLICIEQRRNAMAGIVDSEYTFKKDDKGTTDVKLTYSSKQ